MRNRPLVIASALGPSPGLGSTRSRTARVGGNDSPARPPMRPADITPAVTAPLTPDPKSEYSAYRNPAP